jgi:hypothetical protein
MQGRKTKISRRELRGHRENRGGSTDRENYRMSDDVKLFAFSYALFVINIWWLTTSPSLSPGGRVRDNQLLAAFFAA